MNKKTIMYFIIPILLAMLSFFVSIMFVFRVPNSTGMGYTTLTYIFAFKLSMFVLGVSAIISAILYVSRKE